ncbi:J domain-containing protein [Geothrix sp. 21YS21S-2]|uniref:J domain-containing protein n=1 Tax=Geothrix sp. 21YS21S-2 TaxID=3068893 RepID=UPI0027BA9EFD|nr:J domain-containing protein [Geothrix sp. 21YS21S-2]
MNPYEVLEISPGATIEEIKAAYHRMAKQWHPDRFTGEAKADAERRFRMLAEAFSMLKDTPSRGSAAPAPPSEPARAQAPAQAAAPSIQLDEGPDRTAIPKTADEWFKDAQGAFEGRAYGRSLALILYALRLDNERPEFHALHGKVLEATGGDARGKVKALETAIKLNPKDVDSMILLAQTFQGLGMQARATRLWETVHNLAPDHAIFRQPGKPANPKGKAKEQMASLGDQWNELVAETRIKLEKLFKRG